MSAKILPTVLIVIDIAASLVYAWHGEWMKFGYWMSAASISTFATLM